VPIPASLEYFSSSRPTSGPAQSLRLRESHPSSNSLHPRTRTFPRQCLCRWPATVRRSLPTHWEFHARDPTQAGLGQFPSPAISGLNPADLSAAATNCKPLNVRVNFENSWIMESAIVVL